MSKLNPEFDEVDNIFDQPNDEDFVTEESGNNLDEFEEVKL